LIGGEFDLSTGSMMGFAGICIAIPAIYWGWPLWMSIIFAFSMAVLVGYFRNHFNFFHTKNFSDY
jgi:simple sugar transport system permease protein